MGVPIWLVTPYCGTATLDKFRDLSTHCIVVRVPSLGFSVVLLWSGHKFWSRRFIKVLLSASQRFPEHPWIEVNLGWLSSCSVLPGTNNKARFLNTDLP